MRFRFYISPLLISVFLCGYISFTNPVYITGHLKRSATDASVYVKGVMVFVKGDNKVLAKTTTDIKGDVEMTFTPNNEKSFDFFCYGAGIDTLLVASVKTFESDTPDMTFYIPGVSRKNKFGRTICPKCRKADKVYEIAYGDGIPYFFEDERNHSQNKNSKIVDGKYQAGTCIVGVAKHFCDRDLVKF